MAKRVLRVINMQLYHDQVEALADLQRAGKRAQFIRDAIDEKLERKEA